ncbi:MAG TPA: transposase [Myxococcota bacterium]|nr:transposase [Myxococcota bacterium]HPV05062.1 transposase [Myxococcota bacterium]
MDDEAPGSGAERSEAQEPGDCTWRGRPGRRSAEDRTAAVMDLLSGKATVDQLAARFGVRPEVIEKWRALAMEAVAAAMLQGSGRSSRESELAKKLKSLERAFADLAIRHEIVQQALADRPTRPGKSLR